ncbi:MAG: hypothetical protein WCJ35_18815 [Planctomycetota bacterium]
MGTPLQHEEKAKHHQQFLQSIPDDYPDWLSIVAFYVAVELLEMMLADEHDYHSKCHEDRNQTIYGQYRSISASFKALYNASLDARYQPKDHALSAEEVRRELIDKRLGQIRSFVESRRKKKGASKEPVGKQKP